MQKRGVGVAQGSIDWLCWPRFDSPSVFAALVDDRGGRWSIAPLAAFRSERRYLPKTNVLETRLLSDAGTVVLTDLMPVASEEDKHRLMVPDHEIHPETGDALGNFPQAFTHVGLINAALSLQRRLKGQAPVEHDVAPRDITPARPEMPA